MQEIDACLFMSPFLSLACFFTFYLTFGEIARLGEIERVTISNEGEIEGEKASIDRKGDINKQA
jgi:hypothetical protein